MPKHNLTTLDGAPTATVVHENHESYWRAAAGRLCHDRLALLGGVVLLLIAAVAIAAPLFHLHDPGQIDILNRLQPVGASGHILGTDHLGRDVLSRLIWGGRISVSIGVFAVAISMVVGVSIGLIAGYHGHVVDALIMRGIDILMAFPYILLAIAVIAALGPGLVKAMLAIAIVGIPYYVRITRGSVLAVRRADYIEAQRALGNKTSRILLYHILPNVMPEVFVAATLDIGWMIMAASGLSFLGLGVQPPTAEWGFMLSEARQFIRIAPHLSVLPGIAIFLVVLAFNLLGDGLRDALDPRLKNSER